MILSLLVATDENNVIGKDNKLPWHLPDDLKYFKNLTWGMPILMGRKTFESIGKALPGRQNIVITRNKDFSAAGADGVHSVEEAIDRALEFGVREIFVIGGAEIFNSTFQQAQRIYLTRIHHQFEGNVFFPEMKSSEWVLVRNRFCHADSKNPWSHSYQLWERSQPES